MNLKKKWQSLSTMQKNIALAILAIIAILFLSQFARADVVIKFPNCTVTTTGPASYDSNTISANVSASQLAACSGPPTPGQTVITGPSTWGFPLAATAAPYTAHGNWSATNAPTCVATGNGWTNGTVCTTAASCAQTHAYSATLNPPSLTTYTFGLQCGSVSDSASVTVQPIAPPPTGCVANPGWTRSYTGTVIHHANQQAGLPANGFTAWDSIWGRPYPDLTPIDPWPSKTISRVVGPIVSPKYYVAAGFTAVANAAGLLHVEQTGFQAPISMTISARCGDFDMASANIPPGCAKSGLRGDQSMYWRVGTVAGFCQLTAGQSYYLNIVYANLANSATGTPMGAQQSCVTGYCANQIKNQ